MKISKASQLLFIIVWCFCCFSCIPLKIAPEIKEAKIYKGKKFRKQLPQQNVYVFKDPKYANEFYTYINAKYDIDYDDIGGNIPILIEEKPFYLTFYEVERSTKTINLIPIVADAALDNKGQDAVFEDMYTYRSGTWYIALTVMDGDFKDLLLEDDPSHKTVIKHLDAMRKEYLTTANYMEIYLKNN